MSNLTNLIDRAVAVCNPSNDSALAARMHVSRSAVSLWRKGGTISEKHLTALIALADVDERTAIEVLAEQAETKPQRAVWNALLRRLGTVGVLALCTIGGVFPSVGKAHEKVVAYSSSIVHSAHCILCKRRTKLPEAVLAARPPGQLPVPWAAANSPHTHQASGPFST